jgi:hypothetical protein|tara:strand:+ start:1007 stop:1180 length:174 start_codon:yes stop_codon:yes gene_type:complete
MDLRYSKTLNLLIIVLLITFILNLIGVNLEIPFVLRVILATIIGIVLWFGLKLTLFK